jgi:hypothetical protein
MTELGAQPMRRPTSLSESPSSRSFRARRRRSSKNSAGPRSRMLDPRGPYYSILYAEVSNFKTLGQRDTGSIPFSELGLLGESSKAASYCGWHLRGGRLGRRSRRHTGATNRMKPDSHRDLGTSSLAATREPAWCWRTHPCLTTPKRRRRAVPSRPPTTRRPPATTGCIQRQLRIVRGSSSVHTRKGPPNTGDKLRASNTLNARLLHPLVRPRRATQSSVSQATLGHPARLEPVGSGEGGRDAGLASRGGS